MDFFPTKHSKSENTLTEAQTRGTTAETHGKQTVMMVMTVAQRNIHCTSATAPNRSRISATIVWFPGPRRALAVGTPVN